MTQERQPPISDAERKVLNHLWEHGPARASDVTKSLEREGQTWVRSTVVTLLQRLEKKGYVTSDKRGFAFLFGASVSREEFSRQRIEEIAEELYDGQPGPLILAFAQQHHFTDDELKQFRQLIDRAALDRKKNRKKRRKQ